MTCEPKVYLYGPAFGPAWGWRCTEHNLDVVGYRVMGAAETAMMAHSFHYRAPEPHDGFEDVTISFKWGGKDGKWRWLTAVGEGLTQTCKAGEERQITQAYDAAISAAQELR